MKKISLGKIQSVKFSAQTISGKSTSDLEKIIPIHDL